MTFRSILTLLDDDPACAARSRAALSLAALTQGHVTGIAPLACGDLPHDTRIARAAAAAWRFDAACTAAGIGGFDAFVEPLEPREALARHARTHDIAILTQPVAEGPAASIVEDVVVTSARPSLVLPRTGDWRGHWKNVLVAWDSSREATRSIVDALPFLRRARRVLIAGWHGVAGSDRDGLGVRLAAARAWLTRHGIPADASLEPSGGAVASALLARADAFDASLVVMGGYGPSRLAGDGMASVSRGVLSAMTRPILMSH